MTTVQTWHFLNRKVRVAFVDGTVTGKLEVTEHGGSYLVDGVDFDCSEVKSIKEFSHPETDGTCVELTVGWA